MRKESLNEVLHFFEPVSIGALDGYVPANDPQSFGSVVNINKETTPLNNSKKAELAIIGVCNYSTIDANPCFDAANQIRLQLYQLRLVSSNLKIIDLGNLKPGKNSLDSQYALQEACSLLFEMKVQVIIMGGSQLFTIGQLRAFNEFENDLNLVVIDSKIDLSPGSLIPDHNNFLELLIVNEAAHLYNIAAMAYQSYFIDNKKLEIFEKNFFEHYRLGLVRSNLEEMEAVLRDSDLLSFDISSIRMSDAPGQENPSPNGLYAEEACALARYAGISDRNRSFGAFGYQPEMDIRSQTSKCIAQIIWYYIEGYHQRKHDFPASSLDNYTKYSVSIDEIDFPIVFYKSEKTQRWWLEVSNIEKDQEKFTKIVVSCTNSDYQKACRNEIPERWWMNFKKLR